MTEQWQRIIYICGRWDVRRDQTLAGSGPTRNIIGYCYEDRSGHSCETNAVLVDVGIEQNETLSNLFPELRKTDRHGFTIVFTSWRHTEKDECKEQEFLCPTVDGGAHGDTAHCIWQNMMCDGHQNCGFFVNKDEWGCKLGRNTAWSFGTITILVTIWVAIVTVLMLATVFLLQWNRISFRTPLDLLAESRAGRGIGSVTAAVSQSDESSGGLVTSTTSAPDPRTGGMVSIMVMYRPPTQPANKPADMPPTYDSLFDEQRHNGSVPTDSQDGDNDPEGDSEAEREKLVGVDQANV